MTTKPKEYRLRNSVRKSDLLKAGFILQGSSYVLKTPLCKYMNGENTAIFLIVAISLKFSEDKPMMAYSIVTDDGYTYPPFYNEMQRENNLVYEEVVNNYNDIMDRLIERNILKKGRKHND